MNRSPLALLLLSAALAASPCRAQSAAAPADKPDEAVSSAHTVPPGPEAHTLALTVANTSARALSEIRVVMREHPDWLVLDTDEAAVEEAALAGGEEAVAAFSFSVADGTAAGTEGTLVFDLRSAEGPLGSKRVNLRVGAPAAFALEAAYPNPFARRTALPLALPEAAEVRATVYDVLGREVAVLADGELDAGRHLLRLDGSGLASGVYVVRVAVEGVAGAGRVFDQKLTLLK